MDRVDFFKLKKLFYQGIQSLEKFEKEASDFQKNSMLLSFKFLAIQRILKDIIQYIKELVDKATQE